jgi:hypothetical protein
MGSGAKTHIYTATAIPFIYSSSGNSAASAPISTFKCFWAIYIFPGSVYIFPPAEQADPPWEYIIRSQTQTHECGNWDWVRPRYSFSGNICFKFSAFCLCSVWGWASKYMRKCTNIFTLYEEVVSHIWLCTRSLWIVGNFIFFLISVARRIILSSSTERRRIDAIIRNTEPTVHFWQFSVQRSRSS